MNRSFFTFLLLTLFFGGSISAQDVYSEDFTNGIPNDYIIVDRDGNTPAADVSYVLDAWVASTSGTALSTSWYDPAGTSDDWMITPEITIPTTDTTQTVLLSWDALAPDADYLDGYLVKINTTGATEPDSFTTILTIPAGKSSWNTRSIDLTPYEGNTVRFAFVNNSTDKFLLHIDNIRVRIHSADDLAITRNLSPQYNNNATVPLKVQIRNLGLNPATGCDLSYTIDGGNVTTVAKTFSSIDTFRRAELTLDATLASGIHNIKMWTSNPNGLSDGDPTNDTISFQITQYDNSQTTSRNTVLEVFTSSTCGPCKAGNAQIASVVSNMTSKPVILKYQQNFPSTGDPYTTRETIVRRFYYGINSIPRTHIDGLYKALNPSNLVIDDITSAQAVGALVDVQASYQLDSANQSIRIFGSYSPTIDLVLGTRMLINIKEWETKKNIKTNGETTFDNVVKKIYNGNDGIDISGKKAGVAYDFDYTYQFNGNYRLPENGLAANRINHAIEHSVENFNNLGASIIFEASRDQYVLQSVESSFVVGLNELPQLKDLSTYPNPTTDFLNVDFSTAESMPITINVIDFSGKVIISESLGNLAKGAYKHTLDLSKLANGNYDLTILSGSNGVSSSFTVVK